MGGVLGGAKNNTRGPIFKPSFAEEFVRLYLWVRHCAQLTACSGRAVQSGSFWWTVSSV